MDHRRTRRTGLANCPPPGSQGGERHLVLIGRNNTSDSAQKAMYHMEQKGVHVLPVKADVSREDEVSGELKRIASEMPPLRGIIHAAGIIDDAVLIWQDVDKFTKVMAPKLKGAWNLHTKMYRKVSFFGNSLCLRAVM